MDEMIGKKFSRLTVIELVGKNKSNAYIYKCICECGKERTAAGVYLRNGHTKSCGCLQREHASKMRPVIHGETKDGLISTEYNSWSGMKDRCLKPNNHAYKNYGGRGIRVCERWLGKEGFNNFLADMGRKPGPEYSIDRYPDINGNYEPSNCRWATDQQQAVGRRRTIWVEYKGERMFLKEWAKTLEADYSTLHASYSRGKPFPEIVKFYENKKKNAAIADWVEQHQ